MLSGRALWSPNLAALACVSRPVVVELWGHGRSPSPREAGFYTPQALVAAFDEIRAELGADRWLLCGQSFGAALTLRYALDHPGRVIAQVFTNSTSALADSEWAARTRAIAPALAETIEREGRPALERMPIHPHHARSLPASLREAVLEDTALLDPRGVARTFRYAVPESSVRERVDENRVPTLLVCGERERRFQPLRKFAEQRIPLLEVAAVDAGHAVNLEAPEAFDAAVTEFVRRATG
jgi:pimeloyl-ACP methyl ester carboxylesterase